MDTGDKQKERKVNNMTPTQNYVVSQSDSDPFERIADALESISSTLESLDQSLDTISDILYSVKVENRLGSAIAITGLIQQI